MPVSSHSITYGPVSGNRQNVTVTFTMHTGETTEIYKLVPVGYDIESEALSLYPTIEKQFAHKEVDDAIGGVSRKISPDITAQHNTQADYDRRVLGRTMLFENVHDFYFCLPFFQAVEVRGGANANQRATYLGITRELYDPIAIRYGEVQGIAFFLDSDEIWTELPEEFE